MQPAIKKQIELTRFYPYPIEEVWAAITDEEALGEWLMPVEGFQLKVGQQFRFRTKPSIGFDGIVHCRITELEPPRRIAYHWQGGGMKKPTTVAWSLRQIEDGTLVRLEHYGFEGLKGKMIQLILKNGWKKLLRKKLTQYLAQ